MSKEIIKNYGGLLAEIKSRVRSAQYAALRTANMEAVSLYWDIGRLITARQAGDTRGKAVVARLSIDLQKEFPGVRGFSSQNLWRMRQFYQKYSKNIKLSPLVREIAWTQNLLIMMGVRYRKTGQEVLCCTTSPGELDSDLRRDDGGPLTGAFLLRGLARLRLDIEVWSGGLGKLYYWGVGEARGKQGEL